MTEITTEIYAARHRMFYETISQHKTAALADFFASDVLVIDYPSEMRFKGPQAGVASVQAWLTAFPDARVCGVRVWESGDTTFAAGVFKGTHKGNFGVVPPSQRELELPFFERAEWNTGQQITHLDVIYDGLRVVHQLGGTDLVLTRWMTVGTS
ncbi:ester cyclase [Streptomyces spectabilis]|uniref:Ketosteroid isomerase-like protein n=1 Tax=Streptomyces spectabilis TaxID=68270 RepID=A0A7W8F070_STRST|nr:ester cyclase [Streptomyces spectabilis]MBB5109889.1 ketosteroid isomerase-like protein [Streptomyces spectabilis]GGV56937.1 hypothetical protein GCM10010245_90000 [Streptomyces spectabilis]